jgi:hypothetical protein
VKIILGDMNAHVGRDSVCEPNVGKHGLHEERNNSGSRLIDFAICNNMVIGGTQFKHKNIQKGTWKTPDRKCVNQIDHILIEARHRSDLLDVRAFRGANVDTDHYLIRSRIRARIANNRKERGVRMENFNLELLCKEEMTKRFSSKVTELLEQPIVENNINERWSALKESIITVATETLEKVSRDTKENWFDEEYQETTENKNQAYRRQ